MIILFDQLFVAVFIVDNFYKYFLYLLMKWMNQRSQVSVNGGSEWVCSQWKQCDFCMRNYVNGIFFNFSFEITTFICSLHCAEEDIYYTQHEAFSLMLNCLSKLPAKLKLIYNKKLNQFTYIFVNRVNRDLVKIYSFGGLRK